MLDQGQLLGLLTGASLTVYVSFFAIGLGPVFWLLISEIFPLSIRAQGMSTATIVNWLANLVVALTFLGLVGVLGHAAVFVLYAVLTFAGFGFAYALMPETKGLTLEAVQALWTKRALGKQTAAAKSH